MSSEKKISISKDRFDDFVKAHNKADKLVAESKLLAHKPEKSSWMKPVTVNESEIAKGIQRYADSIVISQDSSFFLHSAFLLPNYWYATLKVNWTDLVEDSGESVADMRENFDPLADGIDIREYISSSEGTIKRQFFDRKGDKYVHTARGVAVVDFPAQVESHSFSCDDDGGSVRIAGADFILRHCKNSMVAIEQQGDTEYDVEFFITDSAGHLLSKEESMSFPLFDGYQRLTMFSVEHPPKKVDGRLYYYLSTGKVANVHVVIPIVYVEKNFPVTAKPLLGIKSIDDAKTISNISYAYHPKNLWPVSLNADDLYSKIELSLSKRDGLQSMGLAQLDIKLPGYFNNYYANVSLQNAALEDSQGNKYPVESGLSGFELLLKPEDDGLERSLFTRVSGTVLIDYPISMTDIVFPSNEHDSFEFNAKGGYLNLRHLLSYTNDALKLLDKVERTSYRRDYEIENFPSEVFPLRAYGSGVIPLEAETKVRSKIDGEYVSHEVAFSGEIETARLAVIDKREVLSIPFSVDIPWGLPVETVARVANMDEKAYWKTLVRTLMAWHYLNEIDDVSDVLKRESDSVLDELESGVNISKRLDEIKLQQLSEVDFDAFLAALDYVENVFPVKREDEYKEFIQDDDYQALKRQASSLLLNTPNGLPVLNESLTANDILLTVLALKSSRHTSGYAEEIRQVRISYMGISIHRGIIYGYASDVMGDNH